jgi:peptidyl-prolyl cis-trans isomerase SurA
MFGIYDSIQQGQSFTYMAKFFSEDRPTANRGGELPYFGTGKMLPVFEKVAFALKDSGQLSEPFKSSYGWHLMMLLDKKEIGTYEEMESTLRTSAVRGERDRIKKDRYLEKLKKSYRFQLNEENYLNAYSYFDSTVFEAGWTPNLSEDEFKKVLFTTSEGSKNVAQLMNYIVFNHRKNRPQPIFNYVDSRFGEFVEITLTDIEKSTLPERFPEYRYILQEYHDGILLFDLMDQKVWTHAVEDTIGLENFHKQNKLNYMWEERTSAVIVSCDSTVDVSLIKSKAAKKIASGKWDEDKLNSKYCSSDSIRCITLKEIKVEDGANDRVDALNKTKGAGEIYSENGTNNFVIGRGMIKATPKKLNETRGQVTSDYQDHLEKLWLKELRNKYEVKVNNELLSKIEQ